MDMSTPEGKIAPKNYVSGISKGLLTPCRRVGLSRLKKTPKVTVPTILTPQEEIKCTPVHAESSRNARNENVDLDITPKTYPDLKVNNRGTKAITKKNDRNIKNEATPKRLEGNQEVAESPNNLNIQNPGEVAGSSNKNENIKKYDNEEKNAILKKKDRKTRKECVKNNLDSTPKKLTQHNDVPENSQADKKQNLKDIADLEVNTPCALNAKSSVVKSEQNLEPDSPPSTPLICTVTALVHHPVAKRNINFDDAEKYQHSLESKNIGSNVKAVEMVQRTDCIKSLSQPIENVCCSDSEESIPLAKRRKCKVRRLTSDSDDFENIETENLGVPEDNLKLNSQARYNSIKESSKTNISNTNVVSTLTRFTTEDYLEEYSTNPTEFQKHLDMDRTSNTLNDDDSDEFLPAEQLKIKKIKSDKDIKNYVAVLCPIGILPEKSSKILTQTSQKKLTISLERMKSSKSIKEKSKTQCLKETVKEKSKFLSKIALEHDSDEEMFTSSPERDKRNRENLLHLILTMEKEVQQKEATLERLKQAQVYKKKHNPIKINESSERWLQGCKNGLDDLLLKMQECGPMDMDTLINRLRLPDNIVEKLKCSN